MGSWEPHTPLAYAVFAAGFRYDLAQDIIYSRMNALQRLGGYTWAYDVAAPSGSMILDCEPIYFTSGGKHWMIELWKGQYGLETGSEIGLYNHTQANMPPGSEHRAFYGCASDHDMKLLKLSFSLKRDGEELFRRGPRSHWWLTGFKWGVFTDPTSSLTMDVAIEFLPESGDMHREFTEALLKLGYHPEALSRIVRFRFHKPKTQQPRTRWALEPPMQLVNKGLVEAYLAFKETMGLESNDPNGFTLPHERHGARSVVPAPVKKHLAQPRVRKVVKKVVARSRRRVKHELGTQRPAPDVFAFFYDKVWHNTHHPGTTG